MSNQIGSPKLADTFLEAARAAGEYLAGRAAGGILARMTPEGTGQPILLLPGFGGGDWTTANLRKFLNGKGYHAHPWQGGINTGPSAAILRHIQARLHEIHAQHGGRKVALIGHSLGGVYARELARAFPQTVSQVITLGSPFGGGEYPKSSAPLIRKAFEMLNGSDHAFISDPEMAKQSLMPLPVPTTAVYTRHDGVVHWRTCINPLAAKTENVEILSSHCGLIVNPLAWLVIADRLALRDEEAWRAFDAGKYSRFLFRQDQAHQGQEPKTTGTRRNGAPAVKIFPSND